MRVMTTASEFAEGRRISKVLCYEGCPDSPLGLLRYYAAEAKGNKPFLGGPNFTRAYWLGRIKGRLEIERKFR